MKAMIIRVGMDKGTDGHLSPIFSNGTFEYLPLSEKDTKSSEKRSYNNLKSKKEGKLSQFIPENIGKRKIHLDPEFKTYTYADEGVKANYLRKLKKGDYIVFYAGLHPFNWAGEDKLYIIGYFIVEEVIDVYNAENQNKILKKYSNNSHLHRSSLEGVVLVVGDENSKILDKAIPISDYKLDKRGRPYHVVSLQYEKLLGISGSIQRSIPPRFIREKKFLINLMKILGRN